MRCPYCNSSDTQVKDSRPDWDTSSIKRRRICNSCGAKFSTIERVQIRELIVKKRNGNTEPFDIDKLKKSIVIVFKNREVPEDKINKIIISLHRRLEMETDNDVVTSEQIGNMVLDSLKDLDAIAYIRFACVYKRFTKVSDFKKLINDIPEETQEKVKQKTSLF